MKPEWYKKYKKEMDKNKIKTVKIIIQICLFVFDICT